MLLSSTAHTAAASLADAPPHNDAHDGHHHHHHHHDSTDSMLMMTLQHMPLLDYISYADLNAVQETADAQLFGQPGLDEFGIMRVPMAYAVESAMNNYEDCFEKRVAIVVHMARRYGPNRAFMDHACGREDTVLRRAFRQVIVYPEDNFDLTTKTNTTATTATTTTTVLTMGGGLLGGGAPPMALPDNCLYAEEREADEESDDDWLLQRIEPPPPLTLLPLLDESSNTNNNNNNNNVEEDEHTNSDDYYNDSEQEHHHGLGAVAPQSPPLLPPTLPALARTKYTSDIPLVIRVVHALIYEAGASVAEINVLESAVHHGLHELLPMLFAQGARFQTKGGMLCLHLLMRDMSIPDTRILATLKCLSAYKAVEKRGLDVNVPQTRNQNTPLHAAERGLRGGAVVAKLLRMGADPLAKNLLGHTAVDMVRNTVKECLQLRPALLPVQQHSGCGCGNCAKRADQRNTRRLCRALSAEHAHVRAIRLREHELACAMAAHSRLGEGSLLRWLDPLLLREIVRAGCAC